jgi:hypothetical protein
VQPVTLYTPLYDPAYEGTEGALVLGAVGDFDPPHATNANAQATTNVIFHVGANLSFFSLNIIIRLIYPVASVTEE